MQCTSITYGIFKVVGMEYQRVFILSNWRSTCAQPATPPGSSQQIFADQLRRVTDWPHKVNDWPREVTDQPHQACKRAFRLFHTNNMPYFTDLSNGSSCQRRECAASFASPHLTFRNSGNERLVIASTCLESTYTRSPPVYHIKMVDNANFK